MGISTNVYERKKTGNWASTDCCPALHAKHSGQKVGDDQQETMLPPSKKLVVPSQEDYTVPDDVVDWTRGISANTSGLVNLLCMNDETSDLVYLTQGVFFPCQPLTVYAANTTATGILIWA